MATLKHWKKHVKHIPIGVMELSMISRLCLGRQLTQGDQCFLSHNGIWVDDSNLYIQVCQTLILCTETICHLNGKLNHPLKCVMYSFVVMQWYVSQINRIFGNAIRKDKRSMGENELIFQIPNGFDIWSNLVTRCAQDNECSRTMIHWSFSVLNISKHFNVV